MPPSSEPSKDTFGPPTSNAQMHSTSATRATLPSLPPMASLLHSHEALYDPQQYQRPGQHSPSTHSSHAALYHSENCPELSSHELYRRAHINPIQRHPGPYSMSTIGMTAPVSDQVPLAQRRVIRKITQRRNPPGQKKELQSSMTQNRKHKLTEVEDDMTKQQPQGTPSTTYSEAEFQSPSSGHSSRAMPISGLLSAEPRYDDLHVQLTGSDLPSPILPTTRYVIRMRQEPVAARACGFGERDRRVIDPPPILQMDIESASATKDELSNMIRSNYCVVHCTLWDPATDSEDTAMPGTHDKKQQRRLMGTLVSSPFVGLDEHNVEGCFFTFPDLSVRTPGRYALKFSLVVLDPTNMRPGGSAAIRSSAMSQPFQVYNAKDFCGMRPSSELTKRLKHQGCLISVKKGNSKTNGMVGEEEDNDEEEDDTAGVHGATKKKAKQ